MKFFPLPGFKILCMTHASSLVKGLLLLKPSQLSKVLYLTKVWSKRALWLVPAIFISSFSHAVIITDVVSVNKILEHKWHTFDFDLTKHGYNHRTDIINYVELSYDFSQMVDILDDYDFPGTLETVQMNSYIFDGRQFIYNLDPEVFKQRLFWQKNDACQKEDFDTGQCELNLDLYGTARESLAIYSGNVWLSDVKFSVDVTRAQVPDPSPLVLTALGLLAIFVGIKFRNPEE